MANYYTLASFEIDVLTVENVLIVEEAIMQLSEYAEDEEYSLSPDMKKLADAMELPDWGYLGFECVRMDNEGTKFWLHEDESINVDQVCEFLHYVVTKCNLGPLGFTWASTCDKARLNAFDGGAAWVSKDEVRFINSTSWLASQQEEAL